jgi:hypothetical protein
MFRYAGGREEMEIVRAGSSTGMCTWSSICSLCEYNNDLCMTLPLERMIRGTTTVIQPTNRSSDS